MKSEFKHLPAFVEKMRQQNISSAVIDTFSYYYEKAVNGETGLIYDGDLAVVGPDQVRDTAGLGSYRDAGNRVLEKTAVIVLNGGLGTSMGLAGPKSLLEARDGKTFLDIILHRARQDKTILVLMNSYNTHDATMAAVSRINPPVCPHTFLQNRFPKIRRDDFSPAVWPENPELEWNPPGHGDIYTALDASGMLDTLLESGITYAFVANSDNLAACMDTALLGFFSAEKIPFMMEVSDRTPADMKGGHVAGTRDGRYKLRETAQCPEDELDAFRNINRYCFFNTNNLWINLKALRDHIDRHQTIRLPMILNPKTLDPKNDASPAVYQIETAMGAAISLFENAAIVKVPRSRFFPVKKSNELLAIRSDCYVLSDENRLCMNPRRLRDNLRVDLDPDYYGKMDRLQARFPEGPPSLLECTSLSIKGDVRFEKNVVIVGDVAIINSNPVQAVIKARTRVDSDLVF
jgi:UTP--glucose-1-phosphate uridylyltransferase